MQKCTRQKAVFLEWGNILEDIVVLDFHRKPLLQNTLDFPPLFRALIHFWHTVAVLLPPVDIRKITLQYQSNGQPQYKNNNNNNNIKSLWCLGTLRKWRVLGLPWIVPHKLISNMFINQQEYTLERISNLTQIIGEV